MAMSKYVLLGVSVLALGLFLGSQCAARIDPKTIVGIWLLDEGEADDASENERHGRLTGKPKVVEGKFGTALDFSGEGESVKIADLAEILPTKVVTITLWVKIGDHGKNPDVFNLNPWEPGRIAVAIWDKQIFWHFGVGGKWIVIRFIDEEWVGQWKHWTFINNAEDNFMAGYIDGEKAARIGGISGVYEQRGGDFHIGGRPEASFSGAIDDFGMFNTTLSEEDIKMIVDRGLERAALFQGVNSAAKLATIWGGLKASQ